MPKLMPVSKTAARLLVAAGALSGALIAAPQAAQASVPGPPCSGPTCVGKDPYIENQQDVNCVDDATTVKGSATTSPIDGYVVVLRWSAYCQANWAQLTGDGVGEAYSRYWVETYDGRTEYGSGGPYSLMVDGTQLARVCVMADATSGTNSVNCSGWF